ncbi:MAG TPA: hypothetical protein VGN15_01625 [Ktedonobacteraceae bacterium]|jgi:transcriptional regulator with XRE-family HTH domain|nr:hypothetical protein [Ktedonobacteraceae bacterium]
MGLQGRVKNLSIHHKYDKEFLTKLNNLASQGLTQCEIASQLGCGQGTVSFYWPSHIAKRKRGHQAGRYVEKDAAEKFPVHPEVVVAKEQLLKAFTANPFDARVYAACCERLEALVNKHHPLEQRPLKQRE